jgi:hypothetical protein
LEGSDFLPLGQTLARFQEEGNTDFNRSLLKNLADGNVCSFLPSLRK